MLSITPNDLAVGPPEGGTQNDFIFNKLSDTEFLYTERLGFKNDLYIIGGGHCALALSELMSKMDFHISLFDDRPDLNTIEKNGFAHEVTIIDGYDQIAEHIPSGERSFVVVMTLGYKSDAIVIRSLVDKHFKYFGVLGSNAKMLSMFKELTKEGQPAEKLDRIRTPVGIPINSRTPEEIAVSIAAEIISVKNSA
jgi:xanthine dehydrogenase accessory factor